MAMRALPRLPLACVALALLAQLGLGLARPAPRVQVAALSPPPAAAVIRVLALGESALAARLMMLWLQAYDYQPGISLPFRRLDYAVVEAWLATMLELDPGFDYPLLAAARLYGEVDDPPRQRRVIDFLLRAYQSDPAHRWPWLAHAVFLARHRLKDLPLALRLADALARGDAAIPDWARQMRIFVLADMGEVEAARVLLGGLLASGRVSDPHERWFLGQRLAELEARAAKGENSTGK